MNDVPFALEYLHNLGLNARQRPAEVLHGVKPSCLLRNEEILDTIGNLYLQPGVFQNGRGTECVSLY